LEHEVTILTGVCEGISVGLAVTLVGLLSNAPLESAPCTFIGEIRPLIEFGWVGSTVFHRLRPNAERANTAKERPEKACCRVASESRARNHYVHNGDVVLRNFSAGVQHTPPTLDLIYEIGQRLNVPRTPLPTI